MVWFVCLLFKGCGMLYCTTFRRSDLFTPDFLLQLQEDVAVKHVEAHPQLASSKAVSCMDRSPSAQQHHPNTPRTSPTGSRTRQKCTVDIWWRHHEIIGTPCQTSKLKRKKKKSRKQQNPHNHTTHTHCLGSSFAKVHNESEISQ